MSNFVRKKVYISGINSSLTAQEAVRVLSLAAGVSMDDVRLHLALDSADRSLGFAVLSVAARAALDFLALNDCELCGRRLEVRWAHEKPVRRPCRWSVVENGVRSVQSLVVEEKTEPLAPFRYRMVDCGLYLTDPSFQMDLETVLARAVAAGMERMVVKSRTIADSEEAAKLADLFPGTILFTTGVHPSECRTWNKESADVMRRLLEHPSCVGVGECGLDFTWLQSERDCQLEVFEAQVSLACELRKPLLVYEKNAHEAVWQSLERRSDKGVLPPTAVLTYSKERSVLDRYLARSYYIVITGYTYAYPFESPISAWLKTSPSAEKLRRLLLASNAPRDCVEFAARALESHRLTMLTHDAECHALTPRSLELFQTLAPSRNEPASQPCLLELVAAQARLSPSKMADLLFNNAQRFFRMEALPPSPDLAITFLDSDQVQGGCIDQSFVLEETLETGEVLEKREGLAMEDFQTVADGPDVMIMMGNPFGDDVAIIHCISKEDFAQMLKKETAKQTSKWVDHVRKEETFTDDETENQSETHAEHQEATTTAMQGGHEKKDNDAESHRHHESALNEEIPGLSAYRLLSSRFKVDKVDNSENGGATQEGSSADPPLERQIPGSGGATQSPERNADDLLEDLRDVVQGPRIDSTFHMRNGATIYTDIVRVPPPSGFTASPAAGQEEQAGMLACNEPFAAAAPDMKAEEDARQMETPGFNSRKPMHPCCGDAGSQAPHDQTAVPEEEDEKEAKNAERQSSEESVQAKVRGEGAEKKGERSPLGIQDRPWATAEEKAAFQAGGMLEISTEGQVAMKTPIEDDQAGSEDSDIERVYSSAQQSLHASYQEVTLENIYRADEKRALLEDEESASEENVSRKGALRPHSTSSPKARKSRSKSPDNVPAVNEEAGETTRAWSRDQVGQGERVSSQQPSQNPSLASQYGSATDDPGDLKKTSVTTKPGVDPAVRSRVDSYLRSLEQDSVTTPRSKERVAELRTIGGLQYRVWKRMERFELGAQSAPSEENLAQEDSRARVAEIQKLNTVSVKARSSLFDKGAIQNLSEMSFPRAPCPSASSTAPGEDGSRTDSRGQGEAESTSSTAAQVLQQLTQLAAQRASGSLPRQPSPTSLMSGTSEPDYHKNREHLGKLLCGVRDVQAGCSSLHASLGDVDPDFHPVLPRSKMAASGTREAVHVPESGSSADRAVPPSVASKPKEHLKTLRPSESTPERTSIGGHDSSSSVLHRSTLDSRPHILRPSGEATNLPAVPQLTVEPVKGQDLLAPRIPSRELVVNVAMPPRLARQPEPLEARPKAGPLAADNGFSDAVGADIRFYQRQIPSTGLDPCNIPDKHLAVIHVTKKLSKDSVGDASAAPDEFHIPDENLALIKVGKRASKDSAESLSRLTNPYEIPDEHLALIKVTKEAPNYSAETSSSATDYYQIPDENLAVIKVTKKTSNDSADASSSLTDYYHIPDENLAVIKVTKKSSKDSAETPSSLTDPFNIPDKNLAVIKVSKKASKDSTEVLSSLTDQFNIPDENLAVIKVTKKSSKDSAEIPSSLTDPFNIPDKNLARIKVVKEASEGATDTLKPLPALADKIHDQRRASDKQAAKPCTTGEPKKAEQGPAGRESSRGADQASRSGSAAPDDEDDVLARAMPDLAAKVALLENMLQEIESRSPQGKTSGRGLGQDASTASGAGGQRLPGTSGGTDQMPETKSKILNRALAAIRASTQMSSVITRTTEGQTEQDVAGPAEEAVAASQPANAPSRTRSSHQGLGAARQAVHWHDPWTSSGSITSCVAAEREARKEREIAELLAKFKRLSQEGKFRRGPGQPGSSRVQDPILPSQDSAPDQTPRQGQVVQSRRRLGPRAPRHRVREGGAADLEFEATAGNRASVHLGELDGHDVRLEANAGARRSASTPRYSRESETSSRSRPLWPILLMLGFASTPFTLTYWLEKSWPEILSYLVHLPW